MRNNFFCIVFCMLLLSCGHNDNPKNSITTNRIVEQQKSDNPEFLFENLSYDFGEITQGEQISYTFHFENVGQSELIIYSVEASCGCTTPVFSSEPIKQGGKGKITVTFDSKDKSGKISNYVVVSANTYPANVVLTLYADVIVP